MTRRRSAACRRPARQHGRHGQAAVEFALAMPVFVLILFGLVTSSVLIFQHESVTNGAREGARAATLQFACLSSYPVATPYGHYICAVAAPTCPASGGHLKEQAPPGVQEIVTAVRSVATGIPVSSNPLCQTSATGLTGPALVASGLLQPSGLPYPATSTVTVFAQTDPVKGTVQLIEDETAFTPGGGLDSNAFTLSVTLTYHAQGLAPPFSGKFTFKATSAQPIQSNS